jgi:Flp pilus assembly protein TadG
MMSKQKLISKRTAIRLAFQRLMFGEDGTAGAVLVEATIIVPTILVVMSIYAMDFGLIFYKKMEVQNAAQAGAQWAVANRVYNCGSVSAAAQQAIQATEFGGVTINSGQFCGCSKDSSGTNAVVTPVVPPSTNPPTLCTVTPTVNSCSSTCVAACTVAPNSTCNSTGVAGNYVTVKATPTNTYQSLISYGLISGTLSTPNISATTTVRIQ